MRWFFRHVNIEDITVIIYFNKLERVTLIEPELFLNLIRKSYYLKNEQTENIFKNQIKFLQGSTVQWKHLKVAIVFFFFNFLLLFGENRDITSQLLLADYVESGQQTQTAQTTHINT